MPSSPISGVEKIPRPVRNAHGRWPPYRATIGLAPVLRGSWRMTGQGEPASSGICGVAAPAVAEAPRSAIRVASRAGSERGMAGATYGRALPASQQCAMLPRMTRRAPAPAALAVLAALAALTPAASAATNPRPPTVPAIRQWHGASGELRVGGRARIAVLPGAGTVRLRGLPTGSPAISASPTGYGCAVLPTDRARATSRSPSGLAIARSAPRATGSRSGGPSSSRRGPWRGRSTRRRRCGNCSGVVGYCREEPRATGRATRSGA